MKRKNVILLLLTLTFIALPSSAQQMKVCLEPDSSAMLYVYLPQANKATGRAVVCCPGGAYMGLAMGHEGTDWAPFFNDRSIALCVLKYRLPHGDRSLPLTDVSHAIQTVRDSAKAWHVNPNDVGVMGSSAGGHLACMAATKLPFATRPDFQILFYPVSTLQRYSHATTRSQFLGKDVDNEAMRRAYSAECQVRRHVTPPAIILLSNDDVDVHPSFNGLAYAQALRSQERDVVVHTYPTGGHGWGFKSSFPYHQQMVSELGLWLDSLKSPRPDAIKVACIGNSITDGAGIAMADHYGYPAQMQTLLGDRYWVRNFGWSGACTNSKGNQPYMTDPIWKEAQDFNPDIVVVKLGTNDSKTANWNAKQFRKDYEAMLDTLSRLPSHPRILIALPLKAWKVQWTINDSTIVNGVIPTLKKIARHRKLQVIDLHTPFETDPKLIQKDGIHPNHRGAALMARIIGEAIKKRSD